jgi:hypothetical protein
MKNGHLASAAVFGTPIAKEDLRETPCQAPRNLHKKTIQGHRRLH